MSRRQAGKNRKRRKEWHNGRAACQIKDRAIRRMPTVAEDVDYTSAAPKPFKRNHPPKKVESL